MRRFISRYRISIHIKPKWYFKHNLSLFRKTWGYWNWKQFKLNLKLRGKGMLRRVYYGSVINHIFICPLFKNCPRYCVKHVSSKKIIKYYTWLQTLSLFENDCKKPVGMVEVFVRLTSQGKLLVAEFTSAKDSDNHYKDLNEFVPTNMPVPVNCTKCKHRRRHAKKCCTHNRKTSCGIDVAQTREKGNFHMFKWLWVTSIVML